MIITDHTLEVERRLIAIPITARDTCIFFTPRSGTLYEISECFYCIYGKFPPDSFEAYAKGFCKFKK